ncbi:hypothetical protein LEP1GSC021_3160 [Leptospira noguchii str. 1993005606]|uniref:Uncharacterized protein n=1 Tax=Leptospira noguchii str. 2007001578 TaxID=1049974 RepID=A0ABP2T9G9_9LEPT|nr:hypothetical protein LEP1GSC072_4243 [Leptospira noguchii str. Bonito]EMN00947.1 hypothetical protein LEP1GSC035_4941 [Leptospira noguchii str. 2007001578]EPE85987.1 hypothetical protein LEP1GSC021_3160 [Leptospira noguchii str. 1993005606]
MFLGSDSNFDKYFYLTKKEFVLKFMILRFSKKSLRVFFKMVTIKILKWGRVYDEKSF